MVVPTEELDGYKRSSLVPKVLIGGVALAVAVTLIALPAPAKRAPGFELQVLRGGGTLASEELEGSVVVVNFFASWCAPCREEAPLLERAWREYRDRGVRFVGVNLNDTRAGARQFVEEHGLTFPVVVDSEDELASDLDVVGLPQTFFIDEDYRLAATSEAEELGRSSGTAIFGAIEPRDLYERIDALLEAG